MNAKKIKPNQLNYIQFFAFSVTEVTQLFF